jgi:hypothetical protein
VASPEHQTDRGIVGTPDRQSEAIVKNPETLGDDPGAGGGVVFSGFAHPDY